MKKRERRFKGTWNGGRRHVEMPPQKPILASGALKLTLFNKCN